MDTKSDDASSKDWEEVMSLKVDLMYLSAARRCLQAAKKAWTEAEKAVKKHQELWDKGEEILARYGGDYNEAALEMEPLDIRLDGQGFEVGRAYAPVLENVAMTHILCAACLEAHINKLAKEHLPGKAYTEVEKMSLAGKWLFLPRILGHKGLDAGAEPFQSLDQIIAWRNGLTHYKERRESWSLRRPVPEFLVKLGLTIPQAERSFQATVCLLKELARQLQIEKTIDHRLWDLEDRWTYFDMTIIRGKKVMRPQLESIDNT